MKVALAGERVAPVAEAGRDPSGNGPDRWRRGSQGLTAIHAVPDRGEPLLDDAEDVAEDAERRIGRAECAAEDGGGNRTGGTAHRAGAHPRRQPSHRAIHLGIDRRLDAELVDHRLKRRDLRGELAGGLPKAVTLHLQPRIGGLQLRDPRLRPPHRAESHQHRQREDRSDHSRDRPGRRSETPDHSIGAVTDDDRVAPGLQNSRDENVDSTIARPGAEARLVYGWARFWAMHCTVGLANTPGAAKYEPAA